MAIPIIQQSTFSPVEMTLDEQSYSLFGAANSTCHPGCYWAPMGGFVTGTYADYGYIAPDDSPTNRRAMVEFFLDLVNSAPVVAQGKNDSHDLPFDIKKFITENVPGLNEQLCILRRFDQVALASLDFEELVAIWEYVWVRTQKHRLFCRNGMGHPKPVQFMALHHVTFDHLVQHANKLKTWDDESYEIRTMLKQLLNELATESVDASDEEKFFLRLQGQERLKLNMSDSVNRLWFPFRREQRYFMDQHLDHGLSFDDYVEAMKPSMAGIYALKGMECLRLKFSPLVYAGQDYNNSQGKAYAKFVSAVSKDISKKRKNRNIE